MKPYIVRFSYHWEDGPMEAERPAPAKEEMFLCLHATDPRDAQEKFVQVTGGESRNCHLISVTGESKIEMFWSKRGWRFFTIPTD